MCIRDSYRAEGPRPLRVGGIESAIRKAASMGDGTTLLFGLDGFRVVSVTRSPIGVRQVLIEGVSQETGLPELRGVQHPGARPVDPTGQGPALRRTGGSVLGQAPVRLRRRQLPTPDVHRGERTAGPAPAADVAAAPPAGDGGLARAALDWRRRSRAGRARSPTSPG